MRISDWSSDVCSSDLLTDSLVHSWPGLRVELQTKLADHVGQCVQIRRPIEFRVRRAQQKVEIFRKARQAMKDTEARTTLEKDDVEEVSPPERIERNFLEDLLDGLLERKWGVEGRRGSV